MTRPVTLGKDGQPITGHFDNRKSGYRESWMNGKVDTRIHSSYILPGFPWWRVAWGELPDVPWDGQP